VADALVHVSTAFAGGRALRDDRVRALLYVGVLLPDLLYKSLLYLGGAPTWLCEPTHAPLGLVPWCYALAMLFEEAWRRRAFAALLGGSWLHLLVDAGKDYLGTGVIPWAFPFSMHLVEGSLYTMEDAGVLQVAALILMAAVLLLPGRRPSSRGAP
jgi:hypothetical protein